MVRDMEIASTIPIALIANALTDSFLTSWRSNIAREEKGGNPLGRLPIVLTSRFSAPS